MCVFFFFQAEDGIRDIGVTGVQTCALPIATVDQRRCAGIAIWGDRVPSLRVSDPVDQQRQRQLVGLGPPDDERVADALRVVERPRAEEVVGLGRPTLVGDQVRDSVIARDQLGSVCQPVNSSGKSPHTSLSTVSSSRRIALLITPSRWNPRNVTTFCAAWLVAGISA